MMSLLLVGVSSEIAQRLRARGGDLIDERGDTTSALPRIEQAFAAVDAVVVGSDVAEPMVLVQRAQELDRDLAVLLVAPSGEVARLARTVQRSPFVSSTVRFAAAEHDAIAPLVDELAEQTRRRRRHRAVVGRALEQASGLAGLGVQQPQLQYLLEHVPIAILAVDGTGRVLAANPPAETLLGRAQRELIGRELGDGFLEGELGRLRAAIGAAIHGGAPGAAASLAMHGPDRATRSLEATVTPLPGHGGEVLAAVRLEDVTEQRRMLADLRTADRLASVGLLAAGVAHEVNNPLTAVLINVERVLRGADLGARHRDMLRDALEASDRIRRIVRDLMVLARGDDDAVGPTDVEEVLHSTLRVASSQFRYRARIVEELGAVPRVRASSARLGQVFLNVVVNAVQAMREDRAEHNELRIATRATGEHVVVEISDNGPGMPPEVLDRLFTPFFTTKQPGEGTGLGLSICRRLVTDLGGTITIDSELGRGTRVAITLPVARSAIEVRELEAPRAVAAAAHRRRVLVIDDDELVARATQAMLSSRFDVEVSTRPREALDRVLHEPFDAILCDLMMPELSGMALHEAVRAVAPEVARKMIFMSGGAFTPAATTFLDTVENARVEKPFRLDAVIELIESIR